jgi:hypothetical protein
MSFRNFVDAEGRKWEAWFVRPTAKERRQTDRRIENVNAGAAYSGRNRRVGPERRVNASRPRTHAATGYENGWLCFESENGEKRRLVWAPDSWEKLPLDRLWVLCRVATFVGKTEQSR